MSVKDILVPDIGDFESVDIIDVLVSPGDTIGIDDSLVTVESDKASMDIPTPEAGVVKEVKVKVGDKIAEGHLIITLEVIDRIESKSADVAAAKAVIPEPAKAEAPLVAVPEPTRPCWCPCRHEPRSQLTCKSISTQICS